MPPDVPGAVVASEVPEGPRRVNDSKSKRKQQTSKSYNLQKLQVKITSQNYKSKVTSYKSYKTKVTCQKLQVKSYKSKVTSQNYKSKLQVKITSQNYKSKVALLYYNLAYPNV